MTSYQITHTDDDFHPIKYEVLRFPNDKLAKRYALDCSKLNPGNLVCVHKRNEKSGRWNRHVKTFMS